MRSLCLSLSLSLPPLSNLSTVSCPQFPIHKLLGKRSGNPAACHLMEQQKVNLSLANVVSHGLKFLCEKGCCRHVLRIFDFAQNAGHILHDAALWPHMLHILKSVCEDFGVLVVNPPQSSRLLHNGWDKEGYTKPLFPLCHAPVYPLAHDSPSPSGLAMPPTDGPSIIMSWHADFQTHCNKQTHGLAAWASRQLRLLRVPGFKPAGSLGGKW